MPMYGLPSNLPFNNQFQNASMMNPNTMMPMPITNPNNPQGYGFNPLVMDVNANYENSQPNPMNNFPINNQGYPQDYNYQNQSVNYQQQQNLGAPMGNMPSMPNNSQQPQKQSNVQQHPVDSNYPDFFN